MRPVVLPVHWDPACAVFVFEHVVKSVVLKNGEPDAAAIAKGTESFHRAAKVLDAQLKGKKFVTGDTLTLADFSLGAPMNLAGMARFPIEPYAEIRRWHGCCGRCLPGKRRLPNVPSRRPLRRDSMHALAAGS
jgi:glutathione S-transferase